MVTLKDMTRYEKVKRELQNNPKTWLITGVAGFIGSNLLETLLKLNQKKTIYLLMTTRIA